MLPFEDSFEITRLCSCFDQKSYAKVIIEGIPSVASWNGRITLPLRLKIECPYDNQPKSFDLQLKGESILKCVKQYMMQKTYFSKSYTWDPAQSPIVDNHWMMDFVVEFEVPENELITSIGYSWVRQYFWDLSLNFVKNGSIHAKSFVLLGIPLAKNTLSDEQKVMAYLIYSSPREKKKIDEVNVPEVLEKLERELAEEPDNENDASLQARHSNNAPNNVASSFY